MFDVVIRGGDVVDGTGAPGGAPTSASSGDRVVAIGDLDDAAADGRSTPPGKVVAPGFVDVHTHYDAQVFWDATLTPSPLHGVTTVARRATAGSRSRRCPTTPPTATT